MIYPNNFRFGLVVKVEGQLYSIVGFQHVKPGKGGAYVRTKLKRLSDGNVIERTFRSEEKIEDVRLENRKMQYLYQDGDLLYFMDSETYEQVPLSADNLGDAINFLVEESTINVQFLENKPISVELPPAVVLQVDKTEPGVKGDTATGATKPATLKTGYVLNVPLFINEGDMIKVDTRSGEYLERA
ncbi:TPA: elongation factor P [bacterium]|nr:elongation factor P [bacterium]